MGGPRLLGCDVNKEMKSKGKIMKHLSKGCVGKDGVCDGKIPTSDRIDQYWV